METNKQTTLTAWRAATIAVIIHLRTWAIRYGASPLKAWDMMSERVRLATRRATSVESWTSKLMRSFHISTVDRMTEEALVELAGAVGTDQREWLTFIEDEHQFLFAMARLQWDERKKEFTAKKKKTAKTTKKTTKTGQRELI